MKIRKEELLKTIKDMKRELKIIVNEEQSLIDNKIIKLSQEIDEKIVEFYKE